MKLRRLEVEVTPCLLRERWLLEFVQTRLAVWETWVGGRVVGGVRTVPISTNH